eukprot:GHVS01104347.1.p1 GENE.GHVS01104347.1~~GHVS01104347.1.p1  ORF type:complete len:362 (-),score=35.04 GHVS01104347.1:142-1227(-)
MGCLLSSCSPVSRCTCLLALCLVSGQQHLARCITQTEKVIEGTAALVHHSSESSDSSQTHAGDVGGSQGAEFVGSLEGLALPRSLLEKDGMGLVESLWLTDQLTKPQRTVSCVKGKAYSITTVKQLQQDLLEELPCVFHVGITPPVVPLGAMYGTIVYPDVPSWVNDLVYQGHYSTETVCNGETVYLDQMSSLGIKPTTGFSRIGKPKGSISDGEYLDAKDSVVVDLSEHFKDRCMRKNSTLNELLTYPLFAPYTDRQLPIGIIFNDLLRIVGIDSDGGTLLLERTLVKDPTTPDARWGTVAYVVRKNFDPRLLPVRNTSEPTESFTIGPIEVTFETKYALTTDDALKRFFMSVVLYKFIP